MPRLLAILLLAVPAVCASRPADHGRPLAAADALLAKADYARAYAGYLRHAARNPLAQFMVGMFHKNGWGRPTDAAAACGWFAKAAAGNIPTAQHFSGDCALRDGQPARAYALYQQAGDGGHLISFCDAGELLIRGKGVDQGVARGLALCERVARADSVPAMMRMAAFYKEDPDVAQDLATARSWFQMAAARGDNEARYRLAVMLAQGEGGAPDVPAALQLMEAAAAQGHVAAYLPLATLYAHQPPTDNGALRPEHLAKVYLWTRAAQARLQDERLLRAADELMQQVLAVMPQQWRADLDGRVEQHLAAHKQRSGG